MYILKLNVCTCEGLFYPQSHISPFLVNKEMIFLHPSILDLNLERHKAGQKHSKKFYFFLRNKNTNRDDSHSNTFPYALIKLYDVLYNYMRNFYNHYPWIAMYLISLALSYT